MAIFIDHQPAPKFFYSSNFCWFVGFTWPIFLFNIPAPIAICPQSPHSVAFKILGHSPICILLLFLWSSAAFPHSGRIFMVMAIKMESERGNETFLYLKFGK
jgi:hypothetical protein